MSPTGSTNRFESTAEYYARFRPRYDETAIEYLRDRFEVDDAARVLDLGCGAGQLAIPLAAHVDEVVGMDPSEEMLQQARSLANAAGRENIEWVVGSDSDVSEKLGAFRLTTMGRSFHWMNQETTLEELYRLTESGGGVALLNDAEWLTRGDHEWQAGVHALASEYLDDLPPRTGPVEYDDSWNELLAESGFTDVEVARFEFERDWDVDGIVGYVFSLSFCSPAIFGDDMEAFEDDLRAHLREQNGETFRQNVELEIRSGRA